MRVINAEGTYLGIYLQAFYNDVFSAPAAASISLCICPRTSLMNNKGNSIINLSYLYKSKVITILDYGLKLLSSYFILPLDGL